ncbi:MAG: tol-pal system-associated acyl-CoA thioesterase [Betaproteobacteria bacterium]
MTGIAEPFAWPLRVYYEDTDTGGVVYYANYLRFMERARTEWLRALGFDMSAMAREHHCHFVAQRAEIDYLFPARLDDLLTATVALVHAGHARLMLEQDVLKDGQRLASAKVTLACITTDTWRPTSMPAALKRTLETLS